MVWEPAEGAQMVFDRLALLPLFPWVMIYIKIAISWSTGSQHGPSDMLLLTTTTATVSLLYLAVLLAVGPQTWY